MTWMRVILHWGGGLNDLHNALHDLEIALHNLSKPPKYHPKYPKIGVKTVK